MTPSPLNFSINIWMTAQVSLLPQHRSRLCALASGLQVGESTLSTRLSTNVQKHWASRLVIRRIEEVSLLEGFGCMWLIAI
jgi:hypothetical protein